MVSIIEADWFMTVQLQDEKAQAIVEALACGEADKESKKNFKMKDGRLRRITAHGDRLYVPAMARFNLVRKHHDEIGVPGFKRSFELIRREFWFPKMRRFIRKCAAARRLLVDGD